MLKCPQKKEIPKRTIICLFFLFPKWLEIFTFKFYMGLNGDTPTLICDNHFNYDLSIHLNLYLLRQSSNYP